MAVSHRNSTRSDVRAVNNKVTVIALLTNTSGRQRVMLVATFILTAVLPYHRSIRVASMKDRIGRERGSPKARPGDYILV
jgi:hypothetical protein